MTREEFNEIVSNPVTSAEYKHIDFVYTFHPAIDNVNGKRQIAMIYEYGGMQVIIDMIETAEKGKAIAEQMQKLRAQLENLGDEYRRLQNGKH